MFSKLFSSNTVSIDTQQIIIDALTIYRSVSFPQGLLFPDITPEIKLEKDKHIVIKLSLPFPCLGELEILSESLSNQIAQRVRFDVDFDVKAVRSHKLEGIKNIIAINMIIKGKSTIAATVALVKKSLTLSKD